MSEEELTELERKIAYHDEVLCDPFCSNDISTYPNPRMVGSRGENDVNE